jgi:hypothetical protein
VWVDLPNPLDARSVVAQIDRGGDTHDRLILFIAACLPRDGWTAGELADQLTSEGKDAGRLVGGDWTVADARGLAAVLHVWDSVGRCVDRVKLGKALPLWLDRPDSEERRIARVLKPSGEPHRSRTGSPYYKLV